jgi:hypothetical protein
MNAPAIRARKTILFNNDGWVMSMDEDGQTGEYPSAAAAVAGVKRRDAQAAKRGESTATVLEWRDFPEGFEPPAVSP